MKNLNRMFLAGALLFCTAAMVSAAPNTSNDIKARMKARMPSVRDLKTSGVIGENAKGFLAYAPNAKKSAEADALIAAENADRTKVYAAIAKQQNTTAVLVGERRALQIVREAQKGDWVEQKGQWIKK